MASIRSNHDSKVKNRESGIDLSIPSVKETPGLFGKTVHYQVVVVSNLQCFKSPRHKESDVVQFMIEKQYEDFETFRKNLGMKFPGTVLPTLPKSLLDFTKSNITDRKASLEQFLDFIAMTGKLATCHITLEFLGVNPITAGKFTATGEAGQTQARKATSGKSQDSGPGLFDDANEGDELFMDTGQGDKDSEDLFVSASSKPVSKATMEEADIFGEDLESDSSDRLFARQDLGEEIQEDEEDLFLVPGAKDLDINKQQLLLEDNTQLLTIEDDLDKLLKVSSDKAEAKKPFESTPTRNKPPPPGKKPVLNPKPSVVAKPKVPSKPSLGTKPNAAAKPKSETTVQSSGLFDQETNATDNMDADDIMKYILDNTGTEDEQEVDLFS